MALIGAVVFGLVNLAAVLNPAGACAGSVI
jgi:hypothetical protein